jgi:hypothetical protein
MYCASTMLLWCSRYDGREADRRAERQLDSFHSGGGRLVVEVERAGVVGLGGDRHRNRCGASLEMLALDGSSFFVAAPAITGSLRCALLQARRRLLAAAAGRRR